jgi:hypothetical protein
MSQEMTIFDTPKGQLPDYLREWGDESNTQGGGIKVPSLTFEGKVWQISINGEKQRLLRPDPDTGDEIPVGILKVVLVDLNQHRGRSYYPGTYDPGKPGTPVCFSEDGKAPHAGAKEPQAQSCAACKWAVKGSKVVDGREMVACSQFRMLAVVPVTSKGPTKQPLRMKISVTSDWDKEGTHNQAQRWFALAQYRDYLKQNGIPHTGMLVTKMKFDDTAFPKVLFSPDRLLTPEENAQILAIYRGGEPKRLISGTWTPNGAEGEEVVAQIAAPAAKPAPQPVVSESIKKPQEVAWDDPEPAPAPKPEAKKRGRPAKTVEATAEEVVEQKAAPAPSAKDDDDEIQKLIGEWE